METPTLAYETQPLPLWSVSSLTPLIHNVLSYCSFLPWGFLICCCLCPEHPCACTYTLPFPRLTPSHPSNLGLSELDPSIICSPQSPIIFLYNLSSLKIIYSVVFIYLISDSSACPVFLFLSLKPNRQSSMFLNTLNGREYSPRGPFHF